MSATTASAIPPPPMKSASVAAAAAAGTTLKRKTPEPAEEITKATGSTSSHILKLKKAAYAADGLWREMRDVPGGMRRWLKAQEEVARAEAEEEARRPTKRPRKKVVKTSMTPEFIEYLRTRPPRTFTDITAEEVATRSQNFQRRYAMREYIDAKWADYWNALVEQYDIFGHAEDEDELTDDEDDDVVKMRSLDLHSQDQDAN